MWTPSNFAPRAMFCLVHGLGEHSGRYADFAQTWLQRGFGTLAFDLQGHGKSDGWRGCIDSFDGLMLDIESAMLVLENRFPASQHILYGHSMGGNLVLNYGLRNRRPQPRSVVASGAFLRPKRLPSKLDLKMARAASILLPHYRLVAPVRAEGLTRDKSQQDAYRHDEFVHRMLSLRLGAAVLDAGHWAIQHARELNFPALVMHGSADELTCPEASRQFARNSNSLCTWRIFEGFLHDIHRDIGRDEVFDLVQTWIESS